MAKLIGIVGASGQGKSTSIRTLNPEETFIINVAGKDLPFRAWRKKYPSFDPRLGKGNMFSNSDPKTIGKALAFINDKRPEIKNVILDDVGMILAFQQFARAGEKGWDE